MRFGITRRDWMRFAAAAPLLPASTWIAPRLAQANPAGPDRSTKSCILLWFNGGLNQNATFHVPRRDYTDNNPNYRKIQTTVPGIQLSEIMPRCAMEMRDIALIRSMSTGISEHGRANTLLHTGYLPSPIPRPALGNVASEQLGDPASDLPNFVHISGGSIGGQGSSPPHACIPAYLGATHAPVIIEDPTRGPGFTRRQVARDEFNASADFLNRLNSRYEDAYASPGAASHRAAVQKALQFLDSNRSAAFDLDREAFSVAQSYGRNSFGRACLLARRLVQFGVPFVEVATLGFDDHGGNGGFRQRFHFDQAIAALIRDLRDRGMLESTLVVGLSEFGRPGPGVITGAGFGHYPKCWTSFLVGGGVRGGQVIGETDDSGGEVTSRPVNAQDFNATVCRILGIDYHKEYRSPDGRPMTFLDEGVSPIAEVL